MISHDQNSKSTFDFINCFSNTVFNFLFPRAGNQAQNNLCVNSSLKNHTISGQARPQFGSISQITVMR